MEHLRALSIFFSLKNFSSASSSICLEPVSQPAKGSESSCSVGEKLFFYFIVKFNLQVGGHDKEEEAHSSENLKQLVLP